VTQRKSVVEMEKAWSNNAGHKVLFIPDLRVLAYMTPEEALKQFASEWGDSGERPSVCLPLVGIDGVSFPNKLGGTVPIYAKLASSQGTQRFLGEIAREFVDLGCQLHLYVNPLLEFLNFQVCHVLDIRHKGSPQLCVQKKRTRELLKYLIGAGIEHVSEHLVRPSESIISLVVDIVDLWGMYGQDGKLYLTCFCDECKDALEDRGVNIATFENFPNPWYLALRDEGSGVGYIDNISKGETPSSIVGKSALRGFDSVFGDDYNAKIQAASELMTYMIARHRMVEDFLLDVFEEAYLDEKKEEQLRKVAIVEGTDYDWSAGVFPSHLVPPTVDELWPDPADTFPNLDVDYKAFMWKRATYDLNAFFQLLSNAADARMRATTGLGNLSPDQVRVRLRQRGARAINGQFKGLGQVAALPSIGDSKRSGIVGVLLTQTVLDDLLRNPKIAPGMADGSEGPSLSLAQLARLISRVNQGLQQEDEDRQKG